jgi:hypothetical protein
MATIQDNSAEFLRAFNHKVEDVLTQIGVAVLAHGPAETPVKTGATLASEAMNVLPEESAVEIGAATPYAADIMTGANRSSGEPNPFLIRMALNAEPDIRRILSNEQIEHKGILYENLSGLLKD